MYRMNKPALLVGSVPGKSVEEVFRMCLAHGGDIFDALPDGEIGIRSVWITFLFFTVYDRHPDIETVQRPVIRAGKPDWLPAGYEDNWSFKLKSGVRDLRYEKLGYAEHAVRSYAIFRELKSAGTIPAATRFQLALPLTESSFRWVFQEPDDYEVLVAAYHEAMRRELEEIFARIPAAELSVQWDVCWETVEIEAAERQAKLGLSAYDPAGTAFDRCIAQIAKLCPQVPAETLLGLHLCYGDLGHRHCIEPCDLSVTVRIANAALREVSRPVDFMHMPVPRNRSDADYFAPLRDYRSSDCKLYLGLVHFTDGIEGTLARAERARHFLDDFGVATECGLGRRPPAQIPELLRMHREVVERLSA